MSQPSPAFAAQHNQDVSRYAPAMDQPVKGQLKPQSIVSLHAAVDGSEALTPKVLEDLAVESSRLRHHPLRYVLNNELHARPFTALQSPERISHLALPCDELRDCQGSTAVFERLLGWIV